MTAAAKHYRATGLVQGVGFRDFTCRLGAGLGLSGWVMNRRDGSVEAVAIGSPEAHQAFEASLNRGPRGAQVDRIEAVDVLPEPAPAGAHRFG